MEKRVERRTEFEALRRLGMRWAVLLSLSYDLSERKLMLPVHVIMELRTSRVLLESGCFSACDVNCSLDEIEQELVTKA